MHKKSFAVIHLFSLLHSDATRLFPDIHGIVRSGYAYDCCGSESRLADCRSHLTENCNYSIGVQCYNAANTTVSLITSSTTVCPLTSRTAATLGISNTITANTTPALTRLQPSIYVQATSTGQLFTPSPLLQATTPTRKNQMCIYATVGTVTVILLAIVGIVIVAIILCNRSARKQVPSPQFTQNNDHVPAPDGNSDQTVMEQTNKITQDNINYEVAPPAVHVYEDVKPNKQNAQAQYEQEEDYASLDRSTGPKAHHNSDSTGNRESTTMKQQHSYSCLNHKDPPPVKGKPCVPHAVNQLSFLMSPIETNFVDSTDSTFPSDSNKPPTSAASNGVYGERCENHVYAILEDPRKSHTKSTFAVHYPPQGEVVGGHQYANLEAPTMPSHQATH